MVSIRLSSFSRLLDRLRTEFLKGRPIDITPNEPDQWSAEALSVTRRKQNRNWILVSVLSFLLQLMFTNLLQFATNKDPRVFTASRSSCETKDRRRSGEPVKNLQCGSTEFVPGTSLVSLQGSSIASLVRSFPCCLTRELTFVQLKKRKKAIETLETLLQALAEQCTEIEPNQESFNVKQSALLEAVLRAIDEASGLDIDCSQQRKEVRRNFGLWSRWRAAGSYNFIGFTSSEF